MSDVIRLDRPLAEEAPSPRRLRSLSRALELLFGLLLVTYALLAVAMVGIGLLMADHVVMGAKGTSIGLGPLPPLYPGAIRASELPLFTKLTGAVVLSMEMTPGLLILWHLRGLFALYATGTVFARKNAAHLKSVGVCLISYPFVFIAGNSLFHLAGGADTASWFRITWIQAPILGLIVFAIARVMEYGHDIENEKDSFI